MAANRPNSQKGVKFLDAKVLIAALSLVVTLGFWNLFSNQDLFDLKKNAPESKDPALQPQTVDISSLPALPTLAPLVDVKAGTVQQNTAQKSAPQAGQPAATAPLRSVTAPDQKIVQNGAPIVDMGQPAVVVQSGGGSRSGAAPAPITTTKSSK